MQLQSFIFFIDLTIGLIKCLPEIDKIKIDGVKMLIIYKILILNSMNSKLNSTARS